MLVLSLYIPHNLLSPTIVSMLRKCSYSPSVTKLIILTSRHHQIRIKHSNKSHSWHDSVFIKKCKLSVVMHICCLTLPAMEDTCFTCVAILEIPGETPHMWWAGNLTFQLNCHLQFLLCGVLKEERIFSFNENFASLWPMCPLLLLCDPLSRFAKGFCHSSFLCDYQSTHRIQSS